VTALRPQYEAALPADTAMTQTVGHAHYAAARLAAKDIPT
jgi:hypothetical protein